MIVADRDQLSLSAIITTGGRRRSLSSRWITSTPPRNEPRVARGMLRLVTRTNGTPAAARAFPVSTADFHVLRLDHPVAMLDEVARQQATVARLVVDEQDGRRGQGGGVRVVPSLLHSAGNLNEEPGDIDSVAQPVAGDVEAVDHHRRPWRGHEGELPSPTPGEPVEEGHDPLADPLVALGFRERDPVRRRKRATIAVVDGRHHPPLVKDESPGSNAGLNREVAGLAAGREDLQDVVDGQVVQAAVQANA
jgi:hypothetical protein